jgi:hypothetical protein
MLVRITIAVLLVCGCNQEIPSVEIDLTPNQTRALQIASRIHKKHAGWWKIVPPCPCTQASVPSRWYGETARQEFHPGATRCYRSRPLPPATIRAAGFNPHKIDPGQQCCYDKSRQLITGGPAAGTPDLFTPHDAKSNARHTEIDIGLFWIMGFELYNKYWPPSGDGRCPTNEI